MNLTYIMMLFVFMSIAALVPGVSALTVSARAASFGFIHGVFATLGIIFGDIIFIIIVVSGLSIIAERTDTLFFLIKIFGGIYLFYLGVIFLRSEYKMVIVSEDANNSLLSSFLSGLLITLADQKAILFYLGFLPAFINLNEFSWLDTGIIILVATLAISTKLIYAFLADRGSQLFENNKIQKVINNLAGSTLIGVGVFMLVNI